MLLVSRVVAGPPQMGWYGMGWEREGARQVLARHAIGVEIGTMQAAHDEHVNSIRLCVCVCSPTRRRYIKMCVFKWFPLSLIGINPSENTLRNYIAIIFPTVIMSNNIITS